MKLFQKTKRYYIAYSLILFVLASGATYFTLEKVITTKQDERLSLYKELISRKVKYDNPLPIFDVNLIKDSLFVKDTFFYKDTMIYMILNGVEKHEMYRQLTTYRTLHDRMYKIVTRDSHVFNRNILMITTFSVAVVVLLLIITVYFVNTMTMQNIWLPFYENLEILKNFSVENNQSIYLQKSGVDEFQELNDSLIKLTTKINTDFNNLKEFTENASHEMQTPLAIVQSKSEGLMQSENLDNFQVEQIQAIYLATQRLSKLNKTLLLLSKIETQQFRDKESVLINEVVDRHIEIYEDFLENKNIKVVTNYSYNVKVDVNPLLFDMVISNLLSNAIKHNLEYNGVIKIITNDVFFSFSNSGNPLKTSSESLFERFRKESTSSNSFGLGLAIVKKVCNNYNWEISHAYVNNMHTFTVYL